MNDDSLKLSTLEIGTGRVLGTAANAVRSGSDPSPGFALTGLSHDRASIRLLPEEEKTTRSRILLHLDPTRVYADAQLDDTSDRARREFLWKPPLRFCLRARTSPPAPLGTFGFGFWNDPFTLSLGMGGAARKLPAAPQCAWFFYGSPPLDLPLASGVPGCGWKAAVLHSRPIPSILLAPLALGGVAVASFPPARRRAFKIVRRFYHAEEALLTVDPSDWHAYAIEWLASSVLFQVDGKEVLLSADPPPGPLGLVLWIDNQYAIASAEKGFGFGVLSLEKEQSLELEEARIESLPPA